MNRLVIIPDEDHETLGHSVKARLSRIAREINAHNLAQVMGTHALRSFYSAGSETDTERTLWGQEGKSFVVALTTLTPKENIEGIARADAHEGMIARVMGSGRAESLLADDLEAAEWTNLESLRGAKIRAMASCPVWVFEHAALTLSCIYYNHSISTPPAPPSDLASLLGRLLEDRLLRAVTGIESI